MSKVILLIFLVFFPAISWAQSSLPPCPTTGGIKLNCYGKQSYPDGEYFGEFQNGVPNGKGRFEYKNGGKYVGFWKNAFPNGEGIQYSYDGKVAQSGYWVGGNLSESKDLDLESFPYSSARQILGSMRNPALSQGSTLPPCPETGVKHNCFGTMTFPNGEKYVGEFRNGLLNGQGTYTFASGEKYVGEFKDGTPHGQGIEYYADGSVKQSGRWENNRFTQSYALDTNRFPFGPSSQNASSSSLPVKAQPVLSISERATKVKEIQEALRAKDFPNARALLKPLIDVHDSWGLLILAQMDLRGDGGNKDLASAFALAKQLAEKGYPPGQTLLARFYIWGIGVNKDVPEGIRLAKLAADKNHPNALNLLGILHFEGTGVKQDYSEMRAYWEKAASLGSNVSDANLAFMYLNGLGVTANSQKALELAQRASDKDSGWGSAILGRIYRDGIGVERDRAKALQYFELSDKQGSVEGSVHLAELRLRDDPKPESIDGIKRLLDKAVEIDDWTLIGQQAKTLAMKLMVEVERLKFASQVTSQQAQTPQPQQPQAAIRNERRVALLVGNGAYKQSPLTNSINDAVDLNASLKTLGFQTLLVQNASLAMMRQKTREFAELALNADVALIFFSGHGIEYRGNNYLIPTSAGSLKEFEVEDETFNVARWMDMLETQKGANKQRVNIVILDACRDNAFSRGWRNTNRGLARMDAPSGTILAYATAPGKLASDGSAGERNSPYTKNLLRAIQQPNVPVEQVFKDVRRMVVEQTKGEQVPWENSSLIGNFVFKR